MPHRFVSQRSLPMPHTCLAWSRGFPEKFFQKNIIFDRFSCSRKYSIDFPKNDHNITSFFTHGVKVLHFETGLGWDHFFGGALAQSSRREASTWTLLDRLDIFSNAIDLKNSLVVFVFRYLPPQRRNRKKCAFL